MAMLRTSLLLGWMASCCALLSAQPPAETAAETPVETPVETDAETAAPGESAGPTDAAELEAFVDGFMAAYLDSQDVAGGVVSVVRDGETLFAKGYGWADVEARVPVSAETTLFRIGSVSKLFTWISVMQQLEAGKVDLDTDVNEYLEQVQVPAAFGAPVTLGHLLTHTPGFDDHVIGLFGDEESDLRPLVEILTEEMPNRVRPPGDIASYSNHGTGLAMHVVEQVVGSDWESYIQSRILDPLGTTHLTFAQPLPESLASDFSTGYRFEGGEFVPQDFEYVPLGPVGAASASGVAMARFMNMLLADCEIDGQRILSPETCQLMLSDRHRMEPGMAAMAHGFMDMSGNGQRGVGHGGDTLWFHTWMTIFPEHELGVFASFNTNTGNPGAFYRAFLDHYFPLEEPEKREGAPSAEELERFVGTYRPNRFPHTSLAKVSALVAKLEISADEDGYLVIPGARKQRWAPAGRLRFRELYGERELIFRENDRGAITHVLRSDLPIIAFERPPPSERPDLHQALALVNVALLVITVVFWPLTALLRRRYRFRLLPERRVPPVARWLLWLAALVMVVYLVGLGVALSDPNQIVFGVPAAIEVLQWLPLAAGVLALGIVISFFGLWLQRRGTLIGRFSYSLGAASLVVFLWQLNVWRLLGFNF